MNKAVKNIWSIDICEELSNILAKTTNLTTMQDFLSDILTEKEITEISARLKAADMLSNGQKYDKVIIETRLSSRTIARISKWLKEGRGGYAKVLNEGTHT